MPIALNEVAYTYGQSASFEEVDAALKKAKAERRRRYIHEHYEDLCSKMMVKDVYADVDAGIKAEEEARYEARLSALKIELAKKNRPPDDLIHCEFPLLVRELWETPSGVIPAIIFDAALLYAAIKAVPTAWNTLLDLIALICGT